MCETPNTLQDLCVTYICENIPTVFCIGKNYDPSSNIIKALDVYFPCNVSEQLLRTLGQQGSLTDRVLQLFDGELTRLQQVSIYNASELTTKGLAILRRHKVKHLEVRNLAKITVNDVIGCLGEWTLHNIQSLNVSQCAFLNKDKICVIVALSKLKNLRALNVSNTDFSLQSLEIVTQDLPQLEVLDISETSIRDISPLRKCRDRLKHLTMYNLRIGSCKTSVSVLHDLDKLCYLDISDDKEDPFSLVSRNIFKLMTLFLKDEKCLPNLVSLDVSGKDGIFVEDLRFFVQTHPKLKFLGLMLTNVCFADMFTKPSDPDFRPDLVVTGSASEKQIVESLIRYLPRRSYIQKSLYCLYSYTEMFQAKPIEAIKLILSGMERHYNILGIQMSATASLYNLSKGTLVQKIHPHWLKKIINLTLLAMEKFPKHQQLQKNGLLTLCSDRILQSVTFDRYCCARLVMESLLTFDDPSMNRMSVAIFSILVARISTTQTSYLGMKSQYMERLLNIVRAKTDEAEVDIMMKFTLSALWNLTDESPGTCAVFLNLGGMDLFLRVLESFSGEVAIETKVLGLINNIAEVAHLRPLLRKDELLTALKSHLHSEHVDVSYFAAGIVAHLASDDPSEWSGSTVTRDDMLKELGEAIMEWKTPETEMVAYRSFTPFLALLNCKETWESQLWAVFAIHHVVSKNCRRYAPMLVEEGGEEVILKMLQNPSLNPSVRSYCHKIVDVVRKPLF